MKESKNSGARGAKVEFGDFGENLVVEGYDFKSLPVGDKISLRNGDSSDDADWKRVPPWMRDFSDDGRLYYAKRRSILRGRAGRNGKSGRRIRRNFQRIISVNRRRKSVEEQKDKKSGDGNGGCYAGSSHRLWTDRK